jgi:hypothetical protein
MTIKASKLAIAIAIGVVGALTVAMTGAAYAAPALSGAAALKAAAPISATAVKYRKHAPRYWQYSTNWGYPAYVQGYDPLRGTYFDNVAPYSSAGEPDPLRGTYFDNGAPY